MTRFGQNGDGQLGQRFIQRRCDITQVLRQRQIEVNRPFCPWTDNQFFHVHVRRVQEAAFIADRHHRQRIGLAHGRHARPFDRVNGDIHRITVAGADLLTDIQHRRFIDFTFANYDGAVDINQVEHNAHGVDGGAVGGIFIAAAQPFIACQRGSLGDTRKFDGQFSFHNPLVVKINCAQHPALALRDRADARRWNSVRFPASSVQ